MSDLLWTQAWDLNEQNPDDGMVFTVDHIGPYYCGYLRKANTRDLMTRDEAANDPEVIDLVIGWAKDNLLTRDKAVNDMEVRRRVLDDYEYDRSWEPTNE